MIPFKINDIFKETFTISQEVYDGFISTFGDKNPLHTSAEYAKEKGYSDKVMQGNILNGFLSYFIGMSLPIKNVVIHSQDIAYKAPVYLGDILSFEAKIEDVHESVAAVSFIFIFTNQNNKKVAKGHFQIGIL